MLKNRLHKWYNRIDEKLETEAKNNKQKQHLDKLTNKQNH